MSETKDEISEAVWEAARSLRSAVNWQSNESVEIIARTLMKARSEQREEDARIAEKRHEDDDNLDMQCKREVAAAIRNGGK